MRRFVEGLTIAVLLAFGVAWGAAYNAVLQNDPAPYVGAYHRDLTANKGRLDSE